MPPWRKQYRSNTPPAPSEPSPAPIHGFPRQEYADWGTTEELRKRKVAHEEMAERVRRAVAWIREHYMTEPCGCGAPPTSKIVTILLPIIEGGGRDKEGA